MPLYPYDDNDGDDDFRGSVNAPSRRRGRDQFGVAKRSASPLAAEEAFPASVQGGLAPTPKVKAPQPSAPEVMKALADDYNMDTRRLADSLMVSCTVVLFTRS